MNVRGFFFVKKKNFFKGKRVWNFGRHRRSSQPIWTNMDNGGRGREGQKARMWTSFMDGPQFQVKTIAQRRDEESGHNTNFSLKNL